MLANTVKPMMAPLLTCGGRRRRAFTLVELLVVIGIVGVLMGVLIPALTSARASAGKMACLSNLRQIGVAIHTYANDHRGHIPFGPKAPPFLSPADFYPSTGAVTSLISLRSGAPVGLGLLLHGYLSEQPKVLFCPDPDQHVSADAELAKVGTGQAQCSYYYRHASVTRLFDDPGSPDPPWERIAIAHLGRNRDGQPVRALAIDTMFLCPPDLAEFNVRPRTHHRERFANILFSDGRVASRSNADGRFTVDVRDFAEVRKAFSKILDVLERADEEQ
ncbi:MAG: type II secretion system protein [Phycisphaerales bacterium]|nr:MAG: type II secretion system protein [Phycisphaerales bacterium]